MLALVLFGLRPYRCSSGFPADKGAMSLFVFARVIEELCKVEPEQMAKRRFFAEIILSVSMINSVLVAKYVIHLAMTDLK